MNYISKIVCVFALSAVSVAAYTCPVGAPENVWFFRVIDNGAQKHDDTKGENLRLWQSETSSEIPLRDIEQLVYGSFDAMSWAEDEVPDSVRNNKFYKWIRCHKAVYVQEFLMLAKQVELRRAEKCSPWYYPSSKVSGTNGGDGDFSTLIEQCNRHRGDKLHLRYGLQLTRLLFASCQYEECVSAFNGWFAGISDNNLMKRMTKSYVAGAWARLGDKDKANKYFAGVGDMRSLNGTDALIYMVENNPSTLPMKMIEDTLRHVLACDNHERFMQSIYTAACKVTAEGRASNIGEWEFLAAYLEGEYKNNYKKASKHIRRALVHGFKTQTARDHARAYKMAIDGSLGNMNTLLEDLKWIEQKIYTTNDIYHWKDVMLGIVYQHWFHYLTEHKRFPMAILLSNYVENTCGYIDTWRDDNWIMTDSRKAQMRKSTTQHNEIDFNGVLVSFMLSLEPQDLIDYKNCLNDTSPLVVYLRDRGRNDDDFLNEVIGTLYLRRCNYIGAWNWLSKVSPRYQLTLNTWKDGYLKRDPFEFTIDAQKRREAGKKASSWCEDGAKLTFAYEMCHLERLMKHGKNSDVRALASIKYALAREASFDECWALTNYQRGCVPRNHHVLPRAKEQYVVGFHWWMSSTYSYNNDEEEKLYEQSDEILQKARSSIRDVDKEAAAEAYLYLDEKSKVKKEYATTDLVQYLRSHCDNWKDWI